jgi:nitric oxide reductase NorD protein
MPEAEDVLIDAAERATAAARALWRRDHAPPPKPGALLAKSERSLGFLLTACFGDRWPILPSDPPPPASWLARLIGRPAPWDIAPPASGFTDGTQIFLPRRLDVSANDQENCELLRLIALSLGARIASGSIGICPESSVARDLFWAADGARIDAWLAEELPGLQLSIGRARSRALARRPAPSDLTGAERAVEERVADLLAGAISPEPDASRCAAWAVETAAAPRFLQGGYRGMSPVAHWGTPRSDLVSSPARKRCEADSPSSRRRPLPWRRLERRVESKNLVEDEENARPGPFFAPFGDPPKTIQDPAGLRRPEDREADIDVDALAEEMERLGSLPRIRSARGLGEVVESESRPIGSRVLFSHADSKQDIAICYPEWDYRTRMYRPRHCVVREISSPSGDPLWSVRVLQDQRDRVAALRQRFERLRPRSDRRPRERDGDDLDLDALVEDFANRFAGHTPSERLYLAPRRLRRDVSVCFLIDASGSTEAWVSGGHNVLEVEKQSTLVLCEALERLGDRYAIHAFSGRGARDVRMERAKRFAEPYGNCVRERIAGFSCGAYTRLGAPIRHLTAMLSRQQARVRLLFIVSDGKPNDEDEYEGTYGIEDTRQAVAEARLQGLNVFCLTIDRSGSAYLPHMFGPHGYAVVADVSELPQRLPDMYRILTERHA